MTTAEIILLELLTTLYLDNTIKSGFKNCWTLYLTTLYLDNTIKSGFKKGHSTYNYFLFSTIKVTIAQCISAF